jgi:hypothetical protein
MRFNKWIRISTYTARSASLQQFALSPFSGLGVSRQGIYSLAAQAFKPFFSVLICQTALSPGGASAQLLFSGRIRHTASAVPANAICVHPVHHPAAASPRLWRTLRSNGFVRASATPRKAPYRYSVSVFSQQVSLNLESVCYSVIP